MKGAEIRDNLEQKIKRRSFLKKAVSTLGSIALAGWIGSGIGCRSPDGPEPPPPPQQYVHEAETHARILQNGNTATGTATYKNTRTSQVFTAQLGEHIKLDTTTNKTENYDITITNNLLERRINQVPITNTVINTNQVDLTSFNISDLIQYILFYNKNKSWEPRTIHVIANPDTDGSRLPQQYLDEIMRALTDVKSWSNKYSTDSYITSLTIDPKGNNVYDGVRNKAPPEGELWVYKVHDTQGVTNFEFPISGGKVTSSIIWVNTSSAMPIQCYLETWDALVQDNQNSWGATMNPWPQWWCFMLNRPRDSNDYEVTANYESQTGLDTYTTTLTRAQTTISTYSQDFTNDSMNPLFREPWAREAYQTQPPNSKQAEQKEHKDKRIEKY